jgi:hypothetical protein
VVGLAPMAAHVITVARGPLRVRRIHPLWVRPRVRGIGQLVDGLARNIPPRPGPQNHSVKLTAADLREIANAFSKLDIKGAAV